MLDNLTAFTAAISNKAAAYLLAFAAVGALTMAIIQTIKELTPVRAWFHRRELKRWLSDRTETQTPSGREDVDRLALSNPFRNQSTASDGPDSGVEFCRRQLIALATAGDAAALYALEIEKLAGQLNAAATIVADFPARYPELLRCLARNADLDDIAELVGGEVPPHPDANAETARRDAWNQYLERKVRVTHQIQRNIDGFQIATAYRWGWALQLCSFGLSFVIAVVAVAYGDNREGFGWMTFFSSLPVALVAGFLAPIARDLLAFIRRG